MKTNQAISDKKVISCPGCGIGYLIVPGLVGTWFCPGCDEQFEEEAAKEEESA